jgi:hypothetical protein
VVAVDGAGGVLALVGGEAFAFGEGGVEVGAEGVVSGAQLRGLGFQGGDAGIPALRQACWRSAFIFGIRGESPVVT